MIIFQEMRNIPFIKRFRAGKIIVLKSEDTDIESNRKPRNDRRRDRRSNRRRKTRRSTTDNENAESNAVSTLIFCDTFDKINAYTSIRKTKTSLAGQTNDDVNVASIATRTSKKTEPNQMVLAAIKRVLADRAPRKMDANVSVNGKITEICASRYRTSQRTYELKN